MAGRYAESSGSHREPPKRPVSLKIGPQIKSNQIKSNCFLSVSPPLPACLPACLPPSLPACQPAFLPPCLPACLPLSLPPCLLAYLPSCLHACMPACPCPLSLPISIPFFLPSLIPSAALAVPQPPGFPLFSPLAHRFAQGFCVREDRQLRPPIKYVEWTKDFARSTASCRISRFDPQRGEQGVTTTPQIIGASIIATLGSSPSTDERSVGHAAVAGTTASRPGKAFSGPRMPSQAPTPVHSCTACPAKAPDATLVLWWWGQASPHDTLRPRHWLPMSWPTGGLQLCLHLLVRDPDRVLLECRGRSPQSYALDMHGSFGVTGWCRVLQLWLFYDVLDNIMWKGNQERQHGGLTAHNLLSGEAWGSGQCRMCPGV